jgi:hypothetical protein
MGNKNPLETIKQVGIYKLWDNTDGACPCGSFKIAGIQVKIHCWRSGGGCGCPYSGVHIRQHWDCNYNLTEIGQEIIRQLQDVWGNTDWNLVIEKDGYE